MQGLEWASDEEPKQNNDIDQKPIDGAFPYSRGTKVERVIGGREAQAFPGNLWEAYLLWEEIVQIDRVNEVCNIQTRWGFLRRVSNQGRQEETSG